MDSIKVIKQAFYRAWIDEYGTDQGVWDAWQWWINPLLKCAVLDSGRKGTGPHGESIDNTRCPRPCPFCRSNVQRINQGMIS